MTQKGAGTGKSKIPNASSSATMSSATISKPRLPTQPKSNTSNRQQSIFLELTQKTDEYYLWKEKFTNMTIDELKQNILELDPTNVPSYFIRAILDVLKSKFNNVKDKCDFIMYFNSIISSKYQSALNTMLFCREDCELSKVIHFNEFDFISNLHLLFEKKPVNTGWSQDNRHLLFKSDIDDETIQEHLSFLKSLNLRELLTLHNYTYRGDNLVNTILRKNIGTIKQIIMKSKNRFNFALLPQIIQYYEARRSLYKQLDETDGSYESSKALIKSLSTELRAISRDNQKVTDILLALANEVVFKTDFYLYLGMKYKKDLNRIFQKAPLLKKPITLYRGVRHDYNKNTRNIHEGFISTTTDLRYAEYFASDYGIASDNGIVYRYTALEGLPLIMLCFVSRFPNENEVLLSDGQIYDVKKIRKLKHYTMVDIELRPHIITQGVIRGEKTVARSFSKSSYQTSSARVTRAKSITG